MSEEKNIVPTTSNLPADYDPKVNYGFEDSRSEDIIIPRIKVINALSPERVDGIAEEGAIINSLTQEKVMGRRFIPIKQYYSNIEWNPDRDDEIRMFCRSFDGRIGQDETGTVSCASCTKSKFDNTKTGKAAQPKCTQYLNFLGFFEGDPMPVVISFARTNYNEGKKMLSIARSMRTAIWNYSYVFTSKLVAKDRNKWYIISAAMAGPTTEDERALAYELFKVYEQQLINTNYEDTGAFNEDAIDTATAAEI